LKLSIRAADLDRNESPYQPNVISPAIRDLSSAEADEDHDANNSDNVLHTVTPSTSYEGKLMQETKFPLVSPDSRSQGVESISSKSNDQSPATTSGAHKKMYKFNSKQFKGEIQAATNRFREYCLYQLVTKLNHCPSHICAGKRYILEYYFVEADETLTVPSWFDCEQTMINK